MVDPFHHPRSRKISVLQSVLLRQFTVLPFFRKIQIYPGFTYAARGQGPLRDSSQRLNHNDLMEVISYSDLCCSRLSAVEG